MQAIFKVTKYIQHQSDNKGKGRLVSSTSKICLKFYIHVGMNEIGNRYTSYQNANTTKIRSGAIFSGIHRGPYENLGKV